MRGTTLNLPNRFETRSTEAFDDGWNTEIELPVIETQFFADNSKSILAKNDSPDINFRYSLNVYRGCEHGCAYCFARPGHEYLGFNSALDFETKIMVKHDAPELLRKAFDKKSWEPQMILMSGNTDCYQPAERRYGITRRMLEVFLEYRNPVGIITKNALIMRDVDLLSELAKLGLVSVHFSITSLDRTLARKIEPRTPTPERRLKAIETLSKAGVPCGVMIGPVIPGLNDDEVPAIVKAAADAGAISAGYTMIRLSHGVAPIFKDWLERDVPLEAKKVMTRIRMTRGGKDSDSTWGVRMTGTGGYAEFIDQIFNLACRQAKVNRKKQELRTDLFRRPSELTLFD